MITQFKQPDTGQVTADELQQLALRCLRRAILAGDWAALRFVLQKSNIDVETLADLRALAIQTVRTELHTGNKDLARRIVKLYAKAGVRVLPVQQRQSSTRGTQA